MLPAAARLNRHQPYVTSLYGAWVSDQRSSGVSAQCSAKGCRAAATTDLTWRNPRIHQQARVKHWLACDEHADQLADFLDRRGFLLSREPR
jgi:hypothetical protein